MQRPMGYGLWAFERRKTEIPIEKRKINNGS